MTQEESYLFACVRYIELNPVRAGMVTHPAEHQWSSFRANARGEQDALLCPHVLYIALGADTCQRLEAYREMFRYQLAPGVVDAIRQATNGNFALGDPRFAADIADALGRPWCPEYPAGPRKCLIRNRGICLAKTVVCPLLSPAAYV